MEPSASSQSLEEIDLALLCTDRTETFISLIAPFFKASGTPDDAPPPNRTTAGLSLDEDHFYVAFKAFVAQDYRTCLHHLGPFLEHEPHHLAAALMLLIGVSRLGAPLPGLLQQPTARWALGNPRFVRRLLHEALAQKDQVLVYDILEGLGFDQGRGADPLLCLSTSLNVFEHDRVDHMLRILDENRLEIDPFRSLLLFDNPSFHRHAASRNLERLVHGPSLGNPFVVRDSRRERIRVGYISSDFRSHATSHLMGRLFDFHDRDRFEIMALSTFDSRFGWNFREVTDEGIDPMHVWLRQTAEHFIDLPEPPDQRLEAVRDLQCDILVDFNGFTTGQSQNLFFQRAAPVQLAYLGYPGTTANPALDGLIADRIVVPPEEEKNYSENILALPGFYQVNSYRHPLDGDLSSQVLPDRKMMNLPENATVFSCFCKVQKISRDLFAGWCYILAQVENSVLWLNFENERQTHNMRGFAKALGVNPDRLIFAPFVPIIEHMARCGLADLMLDTFPYGGHTTATDSVWSGVPCLTLKGRSFQSRVAFSLNANLELDHFTCTSFEDYVTRAITFGRDRPFLQRVKRNLLERRATHPVFDTELRARELEAIFRSFAA